MSVGRELMRNHLHRCAAAAITASGDAREAMDDELLEMMHRHGR